MVLAVVLAGPGFGCKKDETAASDDGTPRSHTGGRTRGDPARLPAMKLESLGDQPGFVVDGAVFAAVRAGTAQDFLRQIPLPGEITRELPGPAASSASIPSPTMSSHASPSPRTR